MGATARPKPRRPASARRLAGAGTRRISPPRPISPNATTPSSIGRPVAAETRASATATSQAGSATLIPPTVDTNTSQVASDTSTDLSSTASNRASRPAGRPSATRRRVDERASPTRACTSTSRGRRPSMTGVTTAPGMPLRRSASNTALGSRRPIRPDSPISNSPISPVVP